MELPPKIDEAFKRQCKELINLFRENEGLPNVGKVDPEKIRTYLSPDTVPSLIVFRIS